MSEITTTFKDGYTIKHCYFTYSCTFVCLGLLSYIQTLKDSELKTKLIKFLQVRAIYAFGGIYFQSDPKHIRELLKPLEPYMQKVSLNIKIALHTEIL